MTFKPGDVLIFNRGIFPDASDKCVFLLIGRNQEESDRYLDQRYTLLVLNAYDLNDQVINSYFIYWSKKMLEDLILLEHVDTTKTNRK